MKKKNHQRETYRLHIVAPLKLLHLGIAHGHAAAQRAVLNALVPVDLLDRTVLQRRPANMGAPVLVGVQHVHQALVLGFGVGFDGGEWPVRLP